MQEYVLFESLDPCESAETLQIVTAAYRYNGEEQDDPVL